MDRKWIVPLFLPFISHLLMSPLLHNWQFHLFRLYWISLTLSDSTQSHLPQTMSNMSLSLCLLTLQHPKKLFQGLRVGGGVGMTEERASAWKTLSPYSPSTLWLWQPALLCSALLHLLSVHHCIVLYRSVPRALNSHNQYQDTCFTTSQCHVPQQPLYRIYHISV